MSKLLHKEETYRIIGLCMKVHKALGKGFLESVYEEALEKEFLKENIPYEKQKRLRIYYNGERMDKYFVADFMCYDKIIIELKAADYMHKNMEAQVINYLKATKKEVGLLINFGEASLKWKRFINTSV
ncbi:GxxExxY protein [Oceanihabitans sediminis]|uniref:GxxExxY protein n=1 Tax=Oceanihabitans sediminis TaxID=1812012 RepID=A0A368P819_9FLAO|nr:GxxExxY protein [Oceanihabitans sediminis]RBP27069.1 GxxExxY protein [Oceanihabitans sediminis]RCU58616.1 GxxExxY protein [Oceanihabitans sediminis]